MIEFLDTKNEGRCLTIIMYKFANRTNTELVLIETYSELIPNLELVGFTVWMTTVLRGVVYSTLPSSAS